MDKFTHEMMGPKLLALGTDLQRRFAFYMGCGETNATQACRDAGYKNSDGGIRVQAHQLMHNPDVLEAIAEVGSKQLRSLPPLAIKSLRTILEDPKTSTSTRLNTALAVLDRTGFSARTEHKVTVEHTVDTREIEELAKRLAAESGIAVERLLGTNKPVERNAWRDNPKLKDHPANPYRDEMKVIEHQEAKDAAKE